MLNVSVNPLRHWNKSELLKTTNIL